MDRQEKMRQDTYALAAYVPFLRYHGQVL